MAEEASAEVRAMGLYAYEAARERAVTEGAPKRGESGWEQYRSCTRKIRYHDKPEISTGWLRPYRCHFCEGWHFTGKPKSGRQKNAPTPSPIEIAESEKP